jgi:hypothetical protein
MPNFWPRFVAMGFGPGQRVHVAVPVSRAGGAYAALWILVIGARAAFTYGSSNWFSSGLGHWMARNDVTSKAIIDGLIFMAVAMVLTRTIGMARRARHISSINAQDAARHLLAA